MGIIAVAGGTGPVGKTIVDALVALGKHKIYVLSRSKPSPQEGVEHLQSNYSDASATAKSLEDAGIDTVICAMGVVTPESNQAQLNLIQAAKGSKPTRRFVISGFDMLHLKEHIEISVLAKYTYEAIDALEQTDLEYTRVANGWFMDYYGLPFWKTHLHPWINVVHMEKKWAAIPGDGSVKATFITSQDMAKFVAHLMSLEKWDKVTLIDGETISMNELLKLAEDARGCKFQVEHDSLDKLKSGHISFASEFPAIGFGDGDQALYAMVHYQAGVGRYHIPDGEKLNGKFPNIKLTSMKEVMDTCWKGKDL